MLGLAGLIAAPLVILPSSPAAALGCATATNTWTGGAMTDSWNTAGNWSTGVVPAGTDDVCINTASAVVTLDVNPTVASLEIASSATLALNASTLTATDVIISDTATLEGVGTVNAAVSNDGSIVVSGYQSATAGTLVVGGNYAQLATGAVDVDWVGSGAVPGTDYDVLDVTGSATLASGLAVSTPGASDPVATATFTPVEYTTATGTFSTIADDVFGIEFTPDYSDPNLTLTAAAAAGSVGGTIYNDANANGVVDAGEPVASGVSVFLDLNTNGTLDAGEPSDATDTAGAYVITAVEAGTYDVAVAADAGYTVTLDPNDSVAVTTTAVTGVDGAVAYGASIAGTIFNDVNGDATVDAGEPPAADATVFVDANANGGYDVGELFATTAVDGTYTIASVPAGTHDVDVAAINGVVTMDPNDALAVTTTAVTGVDGAVLYAGSISGHVFTDADGDAAYDAGEGEAGTTVRIDRNGDGTDETVVTDSNGLYLFDSVPNGTFTVTADVPADFVAQLVGVTVTAGADVTAADVEVLQLGGPVNGYWLTARDGGIFTFGDAPYLGSLAEQGVTVPVVGMAGMSDGTGYYQVTATGKVAQFGTAVHYGDVSDLPLNAPIVGIAMTVDEAGYWLVAADGGVFAFGSATFEGSAGSLVLNSPVVGMAADLDGEGYWLVAADGGIFTYSSNYEGSMGDKVLNAPVVGMTADADGEGYTLVASDGGIFNFKSEFFGSTGALALNQPIVGMASPWFSQGYHLVAADGGVFTFPDELGYLGSTGNLKLNAPVIGMASF